MSHDRSANNSPDNSAEERTQVTSNYARSGSQFAAGEIIGDTYEILRWIGAGGMGNVYCVRHIIMQRQYALKTLNSDQVSEVAWRRFQNEAQAIARMNHPNVVAIYNLGVHNQHTPYYVMDLLQGKSLLDLLQLRGPLEIGAVINICLEVAAGLGYAHKKGIVHRDVKPANIIMLDDPEPQCHLKIVDFGIAKLSGIKDPKNQFLTGTGEIFGSPYYMSPEQTLGERIDARSDIYSLGCTMFELLTGVPPLSGKTAVTTMLLQQTTKAPTLKQASGGKEFPQMLEQVIATLLAKTPMDRYQTMELLTRDLMQIAAGAQLAINPYTDSAAKTVRSLTGEGENIDGDSTRRKKYELLEGAEGEREQPHKKKGPLVVATCTIAIVTALGVGAYSLLRVQTKPQSSKTIAESIDTAQDTRSLLENGGREFSSADRWLQREDENKNYPKDSIKDTTPFSRSEMIKGKKMKVFIFPTDIRIGDVRSEGKKDVPAIGRREFDATERVEFAPDPIVLKYPIYLSRFREGDLYSIKIQYLGATDELLEHTYNVPGVEKLQLESCGNLTSKILPFIDKMPHLKHLALENKILPASEFLKLKCLKRLDTLVIRMQPEAESYLRLTEKIPDLQWLSVERCTISQHGFEYIAAVPKLKWLSLSGSKFKTADLKMLAAVPHLETLYLTEFKMTLSAIHYLKTIKSLKHLRLTLPEDDSLVSAGRIEADLKGTEVMFVD